MTEIRPKIPITSHHTHMRAFIYNCFCFYRLLFFISIEILFRYVNCVCFLNVFRVPNILIIINFYIPSNSIESVFLWTATSWGLPKVFEDELVRTPLGFGSPEVRPTKHRGILECSWFSVVLSSVIPLFVNMNDVQLKVLLLFLGYFFFSSKKSKVFV